MSVPKEVTDLINTSGNNFHAKVAQWLVSNNWHVTVSPYYLDQTLGKAREIDLIAEKLWPIEQHGKASESKIAVRLFIECKYVLSHAIFWFADKDRVSAKNLVCADSLFRSDNIYTDDHHYLAQSQRVAKLFASSKSKSSENEPFYKALNQALNGMISLKDKPLSIPYVVKYPELAKTILEFPVIVCHSFESMYAVDFYDDSDPKPIQENFQLEVQYAYVDRHQAQNDSYFLVDFVEFKQLGLYMEAIGKDAQTSAFFNLQRWQR